ncbi:Fanconi anemia group M protein homolog [Anopheles bellator]|uniref:Fanconi anemia group M protein homolog n=1 Tax=Anopheles bellator TaxID=139047 RepID=UPI002649BA2C|nr:Fanconi anemia group M protein homolog [Anopheles bellator]
MNRAKIAALPFSDGIRRAALTEADSPSIDCLPLLPYQIQVPSLVAKQEAPKDVDEEAFAEEDASISNIFDATFATDDRPVRPVRNFAAEWNLSEVLESDPEDPELVPSHGQEQPASGTGTNLTTHERLTSHSFNHLLEDDEDVFFDLSATGVGPFSETTATKRLLKENHHPVTGTYTSLLASSPPHLEPIARSSPMIATQKSPSVFATQKTSSRQRLNFQRLRIADAPRAPLGNLQFSPNSSCRKVTDHKVEPDCGLPISQENDRSIIGFPRRPNGRARIADSESEDDNRKDNSPSRDSTTEWSDESTDCDEALLQVPMPDSSKLPAGPPRRRIRKTSLSAQRKHRGRLPAGVAFLDLEAAVSGEDSEDDEDHQFETQLDGFIVRNSQVTDMDRTAHSVDMQAIYLQSLKDARQREDFKIPGIRYRHAPLEEEIVAEKDNSFTDDDQAIFESQDNSFIVDEIAFESQLSPLAAIERDLAERERLAKRKKVQRRDKQSQCKRRKRLVHLESSDSD